MGKVEKLNRDIEKLEAKIFLVQEEIDHGKQDLGKKLINKAQYTTLKQKNLTKIKGLRTAIGKKEKARMLFEKKNREKEEKKEEKKAEKKRQKEQG